MDPHHVQNFDLVKLIQSRPCLWNPSRVDFCDKEKQEHAWREICLIAYNGYDALSAKDQKDIQNEIKNAWETLKISFVEEVTYRINGTPGAMPGFGNFFEQLKFLINCANIVCDELNAATDAAMAHQNGCAYQHVLADNQFYNQIQPCANQNAQYFTSNNGYMMDRLGTLYERFMEREIDQVQLNDDIDRSFLLNFLPHLKAVPVETRQHVRAAINNAIFNILNPPRPTPQANDQPKPRSSRSAHGTLYVFDPAPDHIMDIIERSLCADKFADRRPIITIPPAARRPELESDPEPEPEPGPGPAPRPEPRPDPEPEPEYGMHDLTANADEESE